MKKRDEGFTLIELLIVIVILGILATIVVFAVRGVTQDSQENACKATASTYEVAIEAWYAQNSTGHPTGAALEAAGLIRDYDSTDVRITATASGTGPASTVTVVASSGGKCTTVTL